MYRLMWGVIAAAVLGGCGRLGFDPVAGADVDEPDSGALPELPDGATPNVPDLPVDEITPIDELVELGFEDDDPTLTADLLEMYFNRSRSGTAELDIFVTLRSSILDPWGPAVPVAELNTGDAESNVEVSGDGLTLYFARSARQGANFQLMESTRASRADPWGPPELVGELNTGVDELSFATDDSNTVALLESGNSTGGVSLYETSRSNRNDEWGVARPARNLNATAFTMSPHLDGSGLLVVFESDRLSNELSQPDLFFSRRAELSDEFPEASEVPGINSPAAEGDPWLDPTGRFLVFSSDRDGQTTRLYMVLLSEPL